MNDKAVSIVPFGKYKGQPVDVLAQDKQYCEWLASQEWFRTKFVGIHTLIVNHFGEPAETPAHNALQARFLHQEWCQRFALAAGFDNVVAQETIDRDARMQDRRAEFERAKSSLASWCHDSARLAAYDEAIACCQRPTVQWTFDASGTFEVRGLDVVVIVRATSVESWVRPPTADGVWMWADRLHREPRHDVIESVFDIECKPLVGDDYPAILRQMRANAARYLVADEIRSESVSVEDIVRIFRMADRVVLQTADIANTALRWPMAGAAPVAVAMSIPA